MPTLTTENRDLVALTILLGVSLITNLLLHWGVICRRLYQRGARLPTGLLFWRVFSELRRYRDLTSAVGKPLTFYFAGYILTWFNLLLAFATVLRLLWIETHPGGL